MNNLNQTSFNFTHCMNKVMSMSEPFADKPISLAKFKNYS